MSTDNARQLIVQAQGLLTQALGELNESPSVPVIKTVAQFDTAYQNANSGDTLVLDTTFKYDKFLTLDKSITLQSVVLGTGRVTKNEPLPAFVAGMEIIGNNINLKTVETRHTRTDQQAISIVGTGINFVRVRTLGDPVNGGLRGIGANGAQMVMADGFIDDFGLPGKDTQAICSWDMGGNLTVSNYYLGAAAESFMLGGGDSVSQDRMAHNVSLVNSQLGKNPAWYGKWQIKNALEFKACKDVLVSGCDFQYAAAEDGQGAYLIVATVRNQDGGAPWSNILNTTITNCTGSHAGGVINILGRDNENPSQVMSGLTLSDSSFTDIDPTKFPGSAGRLFLLGDGADSVTLSNISVQGANLAALGYFYGIPPTKMNLNKMANLPTSTYGWKVDGAGSGRAEILKFAPDAILDNTIQ